VRLDGKRRAPLWDGAFRTASFMDPAAPDGRPVQPSKVPDRAGRTPSALWLRRRGDSALIARENGIGQFPLDGDGFVIELRGTGTLDPPSRIPLGAGDVFGERPATRRIACARPLMSAARAQSNGSWRVEVAVALPADWGRPSRVPRHAPAHGPDGAAVHGAVWPPTGTVARLKTRPPRSRTRRSTWRRPSRSLLIRSSGRFRCGSAFLRLMDARAADLARRARTTARRRIPLPPPTEVRVRWPRTQSGFA